MGFKILKQKISDYFNSFQSPVNYYFKFDFNLFVRKPDVNKFFENKTIDKPKR